MNTPVAGKGRVLSALLVASLLVAAGTAGAQPPARTPAPLLGWNSYNCYGSHINEKLTRENLEAFVHRLKPHGYEYFVIDAGWYRHYDLKAGESWPTDDDQAHLAIDEFGRFTPSPVQFPNGFQALVEYAHTHGVKFGLHLMRGIPRKAVELDLPIKGTPYSARDIANVNDICSWSVLNYGIDMDKPGAQEYYNSEISFNQWDKLGPYAGKGFWLDMDMIPFGHLRVNYRVTRNRLNSTRGYERMDSFTYAQKKSFITQRAMAASPLFMGGTLTSSDTTSFELITDKDMLACNQNAVTGSLVKRVSSYSEKVDIWKTPHKSLANEGWIGVFNRSPYMEIIKFDKSDLGLNPGMTYSLYDIWGRRTMAEAEQFIFEIPADDVVFIRYKGQAGRSGVRQEPPVPSPVPCIRTNALDSPRGGRRSPAPDG